MSSDGDARDSTPVEVDPDANGKGGLREASSRGILTDMTRFLDDGADPNEQYPENGGTTPLSLAIVGGHNEAVKLLIGARAAVDAMNPSDGSTPLFQAAKLGAELIVEQLLLARADVNVPDDDGTSPLWMAAQNDRTGVAQRLIDANGSVSAADDEGVTPLSVAARVGSASVVKVLLAAGVSPDTVDDTGSTALILGSREGHVDVVKLLLKAGADIGHEGP